MGCRIVRIPVGMTKHIYNGGMGPAYVVDCDANTILRIERQDAEVPAFNFELKVPFEFWEKPEKAFKPVFEASIGRLQAIVQGLRSAFQQCEGRLPDQMALFLFREPYVRELGLAKEDRIVSWNPNASGATARVIGSGATGWVLDGRFGLVARAGSEPSNPGTFSLESARSLPVAGYRYGMSVEDLTPLVNKALLNAFYGNDDEQHSAGRVGGPGA